MTETLKTMNEAVAALGVTRKTLTRWRGSGCPGFSHDAGEVRIDLEEVREWAEANGRKIEPPAAKPEPRSPRKAKAAKKAKASPPPRPKREPRPAPKPEPEVPEAPPAAPAPKPRKAPLEVLPGTLAAAKRRRELAQAEKVEFELAVKRGEFLPKAEVEAGRLRRIEIVKAGLKGLAGRLAGRLVGLDERQIYKVIMDEVDELLLAFAGGKAA